MSRLFRRGISRLGIGTVLFGMVVMSSGVANGQIGNDSQKQSFELRDRHSSTELELFVGSFSGAVSGTVRFFFGDTSVVDPVPTGFVPLRVIHAELDPALPNIIPDVLVLDPDEPSTGAYDPSTKEIQFALYLIGEDGSALPVPMPIAMRGTLLGEYLWCAGNNGDIPDGTMRLTMGAIRRELLFSTEVGFTSGALGGISISAGDLLSEAGSLVARNRHLTRNLGFKPIAPDVGLDGIFQVGIGDRHFTTEVPEFSTSLGGISDGDLVAESGAIVRTNEELIDAFGPMPVVADVGLDAHHALLGNTVLFSTEEPFFSETLGVVVGSGDLLSETGSVVLNNFQLLTQFAPLDPSVEHGLDGLFLPRPRFNQAVNREIWFSTEVGFFDLNLGAISDGDILSTGGSVVRRNLELVAAFAPVEDLDNFGLDAIHVRRVIAGDTTSNNLVNLSDFATFARCFGGSDGVPPGDTCSPVEYLACDVNGDGATNLVDFATLALNFDG